MWTPRSLTCSALLITTPSMHNSKIGGFNQMNAKQGLNRDSAVVHSFSDEEIKDAQ